MRFALKAAGRATRPHRGRGAPGERGGSVVSREGAPVARGGTAPQGTCHFPPRAIVTLRPHRRRVPVQASSPGARTRGVGQARRTCGPGAAGRLPGPVARFPTQPIAAGWFAVDVLRAAHAGGGAGCAPGSCRSGRGEEAPRPSRDVPSLAAAHGPGRGQRTAGGFPSSGGAGSAPAPTRLTRREGTGKGPPLHVIPPARARPVHRGRVPERRRPRRLHRRPRRLRHPLERSRGADHGVPRLRGGGEARGRAGVGRGRPRGRLRARAPARRAGGPDRAGAGVAPARRRHLPRHGPHHRHTRGPRRPAGLRRRAPRLPRRGGVRGDAPARALRLRLAARPPPGPRRRLRPRCPLRAGQRRLGGGGGGGRTTTSPAPRSWRWWPRRTAAASWPPSAAPRAARPGGWTASARRWAAPAWTSPAFRVRGAEGRAGCGPWRGRRGAVRAEKGSPRRGPGRRRERWRTRAASGWSRRRWGASRQTCCWWRSPGGCAAACGRATRCAACAATSSPCCWTASPARRAPSSWPSASGAPSPRRSVVRVAHSLELSAVAEGIEAGEQLDRLRAMDFDYDQGHLFSEPVDGDLAGLLLDRRLPCRPGKGAGSAACAPSRAIADCSLPRAPERNDQPYPPAPPQAGSRDHEPLRARRRR